MRSPYVVSVYGSSSSSSHLLLLLVGIVVSTFRVGFTSSCAVERVGAKGIRKVANVGESGVLGGGRRHAGVIGTCGLFCLEFEIEDADAFEDVEVEVVGDAGEMICID